jgi:hypothetical protein
MLCRNECHMDKTTHEAELRRPTSSTSPSRWGQVEMRHEQNVFGSQPGRA